MIKKENENDNTALWQQPVKRLLVLFLLAFASAILYFLFRTIGNKQLLLQSVAAHAIFRFHILKSGLRNKHCTFK